MMMLYERLKYSECVRHYIMFFSADCIENRYKKCLDSIKTSKVLIAHISSRIAIQLDYLNEKYLQHY